MKKCISVLVSLMLLTCLLCGAGAAEEAKTIRVVTTIFPIYDWVREVTGADAEGVDVTLLLDSGVDLHSYQPTAQDILAISSADLFIYVGGESDEWVEDVIASAMNPDLKAVSLLDALGDDVKAEETVEGMEPEHEEEGEGEEEEEEPDEHVWLSLRNAEKLTAAIAAALAEADPARADLYAANAAAYTEKLDALDAQYTETVENAGFSTLLFGDRFPFRYLADDYSLTYFAAFSGCSAESEASFATIVFLAQKVDELGLPAVMTIEYPKTKIADTIVQNTAEKNQKILTLDSMQGTTQQDIQNGTTYLSVMASNLDVLKEALNK